MNNELTIAIIGAITTFISGFTSWFFTRKKYNTEVDASTIDNMKESLSFYVKLANDNKDRLDEIIVANKDLRARNDKLEIKNDKLEEEIKKIRTDMFNLLGQICLNMQCTMRERGIPLNNGVQMKKNTRKESESKSKK